MKISEVNLIILTSDDRSPILEATGCKYHIISVINYHPSISLPVPEIYGLNFQLG